MSEKKTNIQSNNIRTNQYYSDSDISIEDNSKSEKKKSKSSHFGRPRKYPYKPGKYKCVYCETLCSKPSVLTKHMRAHTNERPFPCSVCKRSFKTKSNLSKHEKSKSHSSKLESHVTIENKQSKKEKFGLMLETLSDINPCFHNVDGVNNMEFDDFVERPPDTKSNNSSITSGEEKLIISEEMNSLESIKKEKQVDDIMENVAHLPESVQSSSCPGVLTINSQSGPIAVEVQINLETMRYLQQGLINLTNKKSSPSSSVQSISSRNDADLKAAESILHMATQCSKEVLISNEDVKKNGKTTKKILGTMTSSVNGKGSEHCGFYKSISLPGNISKSEDPQINCSNKSIDDFDSIHSKIYTKSLVKENLLKKMKKKQVQECSRLIRSPGLGIVCTSESYQNNSLTEPSFAGPLFRQNDFNANVTGFNNKNEGLLKSLMTDSKSLLSLKSSKVKSVSMLQHPKILNSNSSNINCFTTASNSQTIVLLSTSSNASVSPILLNTKSISTINLESFSEPSKFNIPVSSSVFNNDATTLSKVITNTQNLHQHQDNKTPTTCKSLVTECSTTSKLTISSTSVEPKTENPQIHNVTNPFPIFDALINNEQAVEVDESHIDKQREEQISQDLQKESSPGSCLVETTLNKELYNNNDKKSESDEEIDVVNTDSDDDRLPLQRMSEFIFSETVSKRCKLSCADDADSKQKEGKRIKEVEKCIPLHAPNINAKDLMQDCPLNLSANRQPIIPFVSQFSGAVFQNIYQTISPSVANPLSINGENPQDTDTNISALTNYNPAHPQSFDNLSSNTTVSLNGHHHDYPILFEDKLCCDVCSQMIEPSMLSLHKNMHIYTNTKDSHQNSSNNKSGSVSSVDSSSLNSKIPFNKPRNYKCVVCNIGFRVGGHLCKHHKSKTHLQGLVNSGFLSKTLYSKIEQAKVPIQEVIDQNTGNIIPDLLSRYISNWSQTNTDNEPH